MTKNVWWDEKLTFKVDFKVVFRPGSFEAVVQCLTLRIGSFEHVNTAITLGYDKRAKIAEEVWSRLASNKNIITSATSTTCCWCPWFSMGRPDIQMTFSTMCQALIFRPVETSVPDNFILLLRRISDQSERSWFAHTTLDRSRLLLCEHGRNRFSPSIGIKQTSHMSEYTLRQDVGSGVFGHISTHKTREWVGEE